MTPSQKTDFIVLGMGCFWGAEKCMAEIPGVLTVESGYAGGDLAGAGYQEILNHERALHAGKTTAHNHAEVVKVTFDSGQVRLETVLSKFWESHNPTQGNRQGNDVGSNYRSAIYYNGEAQKAAALATRTVYQQALDSAGFGRITTEILPLKNYTTAEEYHQNYLKKNPNGYCGLGGTGVKYPESTNEVAQGRGYADVAPVPVKPLNPPDSPSALSDADLNFAQQLIVFESENCEFCRLFKMDILNHWQSELPIVAMIGGNPPAGWSLKKPLFAAPTIVLFKDGSETARYPGYHGDKSSFWKWLGLQLLSSEQQQIAFQQGTEPPFTAPNLDEKRPGRFVDPITGAPLFLSDTKFESGTGWPSFFDCLEAATTLHEDHSHGGGRIEVRSASSGIHLGHVFNDGPSPTFKRYCINGNVLKFVPDEK